MTEDAYYESSDSKACNDAWKGWNDFCDANFGREDCDAVWSASMDAMIEIQRALAPPEECGTEDAYYYRSDSKVCNDAWRVYFDGCYAKWTDQC